MAALFLSGFERTAYPVYVTGHLKKNPKNGVIDVKDVHVVVKGEGKILAKAVSDAKGNFELEFTPGKQPSFDFFCSVRGYADTILIGSFKTFDSDTPDIIFYVPSLTAKDAAGKTVCLRRIFNSCLTAPRPAGPVYLRPNHRP